MQKLIIIILTVVITISGCDLIDRINPFSGKADDSMEIYQRQQDSLRRAELLRVQREEAAQRQAREDSERLAAQQLAEMARSVGRYHLIVGAFKTPAYAREFHEKMLSQGHESRIITSENNFHLVTIKSHDDYRTAVSEWRSIRNQGEHLVWLYIKEI
jgi:cell division protein FtsN